MATFGERLRESRDAKGLSRRALAEAAGVTTMTIQRYEKGESNNPGIATLEAIAGVLSVDPRWLFSGTAPSVDVGVTDSHIEPVDEPPLLKRARESGSWPDWVLAAVPEFSHHRDGRYSYGELVDFLDKIHDAGREELERLKNRIGPPKRQG